MSTETLPKSEKGEFLIPTEIERKFVINELPEGLEHYDCSFIKQGYLVIGADGSEARLRDQDGEHTLTVKSKGDLSRGEWEIPVVPIDFDSLWSATNGKRIEKVRYTIPYDEAVIELDIYDGPLLGLVTAEVEFPDEKSATNFVEPDWFSDEVTADRAFKNQSLATKGMPPNVESVGAAEMMLFRAEVLARNNLTIDRVLDELRGIETTSLQLRVRKAVDSVCSSALKVAESSGSLSVIKKTIDKIIGNPEKGVAPFHLRIARGAIAKHNLDEKYVDIVEELERRVFETVEPFYFFLEESAGDFLGRPLTEKEVFAMLHDRVNDCNMKEFRYRYFVTRNLGERYFESPSTSESRLEEYRALMNHKRANDRSDY
ncbi:hypothetical protein COU14_00740 [Candidatus Kaiserbacteria bacterium CG10_big_fil_rev_8_21_14_0_10_44_10]|uniref:CYTH domain-containing protein n=1 Tax=Candidatus Kaiserbacteria bacterium CG10_big_fil_rev_8_21_14_0_10_44_10 TaxID=1974606 RepID=A0A2H0UI59_9BACT|nr:MAG: hypothetical protein COU14_00740 [Candidatus Kaiserbacteria bacterium CG10_big_fil_rev_8_21_14_0_10_44_10]